MPVFVQIRGLNETVAALGAAHSDQVPFATALALTRTAQEVQRAERGQLGAKFILRQRAFMTSGIRIEAATKRKLMAVVKDIHAFMAKQEEGAIKIPFGKYLAVPVVGGARKSERANIRPEDMPHAVMEQGGIIRDYRGFAVMFRINKAVPTWTRRGGRRRGRLVPMYVLAPKARVEPRYGFEQTAEKVANATFEKNFSDAFNRAVKTAK
jgi:hypothetical protein